jgi:NTE family protein
MTSLDDDFDEDASPQARAAAAVAPVRPRKDGIALCLSGGGFRASLFHLGALRRLHETGILQHASAISSVSGGSILSAFLATRLHQLGRSLSQGFADWHTEVAEPFRAFCSRDFRTLPILAHALWNWVWPDPLVWHLERRYRQRLTALALKDLPEVPRFVLCATDLTFGVSWEFSRAGARDYQAGYLPAASEWPLARAVAASASFPPLFGPVGIRTAADGYRGGKFIGPDRDRLLRRIQLSDGGVYDNMGLEPVWKVWTHVLISDCGAPFEFRLDTTPLRRLLRYAAVVTSQTRALRLRSFFGDLNAGRYQGAYMSLMSGAKSSGARPGEPAYVGYSQELTDLVLRKIRTDLDSFSEAEMAVLENHGYWAAERAISKHQPGLVRAGAPEAASPYPEWNDEAKVRRELRDSHQRIALRRIFRRPRASTTRPHS